MAGYPDRALLHKTHLKPFQNWLIENGILWRAPRGPYQVMQVECGAGWQCIYERDRMPEHFTTTGPLVGLVKAFIRDYQKSRPARPEPVKVYDETVPPWEAS